MDKDKCQTYYGSKYWGIKVRREVSSEGYIFTWANDIEITANGDLITKNQGQNEFPGLILSKSQWYYCFAASVFTGEPITIEYWKSGKVSRRPINIKTRTKVLERDNFTCVNCGRAAIDGVVLHIDHIKPISKGGTDEIYNLRTLCADCNKGKASSIEKKGEIQRVINVITKFVEKHPGSNQTNLKSGLINDIHMSDTKARYYIALAENREIIVRRKGVRGSYAYFINKD